MPYLTMIEFDNNLLTRMETVEPSWVVGFTDGEGTFSILFSKQKIVSKKIRIRSGVHRYGVWVHLAFTISQNERVILEDIRDFFGFGYVNPNHNDSYQYYVHKLSDLQKIRDFFIKYPLKTKKKRLDFSLWCKAMALMEKKEHRTKAGLLKIAGLRDKQNRDKGRKTARKTEELLEYINTFESLRPSLRHVIWSQTEIDYLKKNYLIQTDKELSKALNHPKDAVRSKRRVLGLMKYINPQFRRKRN